MGLSLFKLEKLRVTAYTEAERGPLCRAGQFEAMFNPASYRRSYALEWGGKPGLNASSQQLEYRRSKPSDLEVKLLLDGTGVDEMGLFRLGRKSVKERVKAFLEVAYNYSGDIHEPHYLVVEWGSLSLACRLGKVDVNYTAFHRDGTPLRAELDVTFLADQELRKRLRTENKQSPDVTHSRIVRQGDTLSLLTREIYGSAAHYLAVARYNGLDDFRFLEAGRTLVFPPLASLTGGG